jgi:GT2 family glycosyltransferase
VSAGRVNRVAPASVLIPTRDRGALVTDAVRAVWEGTVLPAELVVADQSARPDPLPEPPDGCRLVHLRLTGTGLSRGRNAAAAAATSPVLVFIDDDIIVAREWLSTLLRALAQAPPGAVATGRIAAGSSELPGAVQFALRDSPAPALYRGPQRRDVLSAANMAIHRSSFEEIGGFDERLGAGTGFPGAEDNDLGFRLALAGKAVLYVPDAVVVHRAWRDPGSYLALRYAYGVGQGAFYAKHAPSNTLYVSRRAAGQVIHYLVRLPWRAVRHPRRALGDVVFLKGLVVGAYGWRTRVAA